MRMIHDRYLSADFRRSFPLGRELTLDTVDAYGSIRYSSECGWYACLDGFVVWPPDMIVHLAGVSIPQTSPKGAWDQAALALYARLGELGRPGSSD